MTKIVLISFLFFAPLIQGFGLQSRVAASRLDLDILTSRGATCANKLTSNCNKKLFRNRHDRLGLGLGSKTTKTDEEWKMELPPLAYRILREEGTEPAFSSSLNDVEEDGTFACAGCGSPLFRKETKFDSGTGWPSFYAPLDGAAVDLSADFKLILPRTECSCASCNGHLGHVFDDGPKPTGQRYCLNGAAMSFRPDAREDPDSAFLQSVLSREAGTEAGQPQLPKSPILSVLPVSLLYGGAAFGYANSFITQFTEAQQAGTSFPAAPIDFLPVPLFVACAYFSLKGLLRLF